MTLGAQDAPLVQDDSEIEAIRGEANRLYDEKKFDEALIAGEKLLEIRTRKLGPEHLDVARSLNYLAGVHENLKQFGAAEKRYMETLALREKLAGPDSILVAQTCTDLGWMLKDLKRFDDAERLLRRALALREKLLGPAHFDIVWSLRNLGEVLVLQNDHARAEPLLERAFTMWRQIPDGNRGDLQRIASKLDLCRLKLQHWRERSELARQMATEEEAQQKPNRKDAGEWWWRCANARRELREHSEAVPLFEKALAHFESESGPQSLAASTVLVDLGRALFSTQRFEEARARFQRAAAIKLKSSPAQQKLVSEIYAWAAWCDWRLKRFPEAEELLRKAAKLAEANGDLRECRQRWDNLITVLENGKLDSSKAEVLQTLVTLEEKISGADSDATLKRVATLASWLERQGRGSEARSLRKRWRSARPPWAPPLHLVEWTESAAKLQAAGLFGFPQSQARILEDEPDFRLSTWSNREWLLFQCIWRDDGDDTIVEGSDGAQKNDTDSIILDVDGDQQWTPEVDRFYLINLNPGNPRVTGMDTISATSFKPFIETEARGCIRYVRLPNEGIWRVGTIAIPLSELKLAGEAIARVLYHCRSSRPEVNRCSARQPVNKFASYSSWVPHADYLDLPLGIATGSFDPTCIPDGKNDRFVLDAP